MSIERIPCLYSQKYYLTCNSHERKRKDQTDTKLNDNKHTTVNHNTIILTIDYLEPYFLLFWTID